MSLNPQAPLTFEEYLTLERGSEEKSEFFSGEVFAIEVLSDSTEAYDRGKEFEHYQKIESLREYVLVAQDKFRVEQYARQDNNQWIYVEIHNPDDSLRLVSVSGELILKEVYARVNVELPDETLGGEDNEKP